MTVLTAYVFHEDTTGLTGKRCPKCQEIFEERQRIDSHRRWLKFLSERDARSGNVGGSAAK
jgi:hypothetical protein